MERDTAATEKVSHVANMDCMEFRRQIREHIQSIANDLDSDGVRHAIIAVGNGYMIIRSNNNIRSVVRTRISSETFAILTQQCEAREEILRALREALEDAERHLLARRGRGV